MLSSLETIWLPNIWVCFVFQKKTFNNIFILVIEHVKFKTAEMCKFCQACPFSNENILGSISFIWTQQLRAVGKHIILLLL